MSVQLTEEIDSLMERNSTTEVLDAIARNLESELCRLTTKKLKSAVYEVAQQILAVRTAQQSINDLYKDLKV